MVYFAYRVPVHYKEDLNEQEKKSFSLITALYCRLSLEDDRDNESMSISNQKAMLRMYAEQKGMFIYVYVNFPNKGLMG